MAESEKPSGSLFDSTRRLLDTGLAALQNRLELIVVEWREEKYRLLELFFCAAGLVFFAMMGLVTVTFTLVFLFWENAKWILMAMSVAYIVGGVWAAWQLRKKLNGPQPLSSTISEINKDRQCLVPQK